MIPTSIYLDNASTTKVDNCVIEAMIPYMNEYYGNPSSNHQFGKIIRDKVDSARKSVSELIGANFDEIVFTSGATESINTIFKSLINNSDNRNKIIIPPTEHSAVLETCSYLEIIGFEIIKVPVLSNGLIDIDRFKELIDEQTLMVSVMLVNNETGVIQPIKEISKIAKKYGSYVMTDATQGVGKIPVSVDNLGIDFLVFSGHKFHAPKGIGGFYLKSNIADFNALFHGGGQEKGLRSSTLNVPGIVGIGKAAEIAIESMDHLKIISKNYS